MGAELQRAGRLAALPRLHQPLRVRDQVAQEKEHRAFPGQAGGARALEGGGAAPEVRGERREREVGPGPQPGHRLRRKLDGELLRLALHVAEQRLRFHFAPGPLARPRLDPARQLRGGGAQPPRQPRVGEGGADGEQIEEQPARGVHGGGAHLLRVDQQPGGEQPGRRRQRRQREEQIVAARFQHQLGRSRSDGGLGDRLAFPQPHQRLRQLVHCLQHARLADARGNVDAVDLDAEDVEDVGAVESLRARAAERAQFPEVGGIEAPRSPRPDADHDGRLSSLTPPMQLNRLIELFLERRKGSLHPVPTALLRSVT